MNNLCRNELNWWLEKVDEFNYKEIKPEIIEEQLITDASSFEWGAKLGDLEAKGDWNQRVSKVSKQSSNYRELLAILLALSAFKDELEGKCIQILTDNVTAAAQSVEEPQSSRLDLDKAGHTHTHTQSVVEPQSSRLNLSKAGHTHTHTQRRSHSLLDLT